MIEFKQLLKLSDLRQFTAKDVALPSLPKDGTEFIKEVVRRFPSGNAAFPTHKLLAESLEIAAQRSASSSWYAHRTIRIIIWEDDLIIKGDLFDEDSSTLPVLIVKGNLTLRNWLRGGMVTFVGGSVNASGFIIGYFDDSALFVGGDLSAAGYIPRAKPYKDIPHVIPHQIAGTVYARKFDNVRPTNEQLQAAFVDEVLTKEDDDLYLDERAAFERSNAGLSVWR